MFLLSATYNEPIILYTTAKPIWEMLILQFFKMLAYDPFRVEPD